MTSALYAPLANSMLQQLDSNYEWLQLHVGSPGAAGTSNIAAESTRNQVEWDVAASGVISIVDPIAITTVAATETWTYFTAWSLATGGVVGVRGTITLGQVLVGANVTIPAASVTVTFPLAGA